jgi:hypothetical protein
MSATLFDTDFFATDSLRDARSAVSARTPIQRPGLFFRILDAIGSAYTVKMPDGEIVAIFPPI